MMKLMVNGENSDFDGPPTVAALLDAYRLQPVRVAVEVNESLVRRTEFERTPLKDGDRVEIVTLVGGG